MLSLDEHEHTDSHGATLARFGRYLWIADRMGNRMIVIDTWTDELANEIPLVGPLATDPAPDLMDASPRGDRLYVSLRGAIPLSGDPHASTGNSAGLCVIKVSKSGRSGRIESITRITNVDAGGRRPRRPARPPRARSQSQVGRVSALTKSSSWRVVQHSWASQKRSYVAMTESP